jgi:hypothetical protein
MTPKQRMLNAYRGAASDRPPVAPEFWYYYPARLLGVDMIAFEREVPLWSALKTAFARWSCEGWGAAFPEIAVDGVSVERREEKIAEGRFRERTVQSFRGRQFTATRIYDLREPSATETYPAADPRDTAAYLEMCLAPGLTVDFSDAVRGYSSVGESYLLELWLGLPFFDWIAEAAGFQQAVLWVSATPQAQLIALRERYSLRVRELMRRAAALTLFESFVVGCSSSCNSLLGPVLWRALDAPFLRAVAQEAHALGKLLHIHFHGRSRESLDELAQLGADCICPFERPPGGDIAGIEGLRAVRAALGERVTFNGNVHTVDTLIRGSPQDVRREIRQIKSAFAGSRRFIIGTGDQVGGETPEQNIEAMIEEGMRG